MNNNTCTLHDKTFHLYLTEAQIQTRIRELAVTLDEAYRGKSPLMLGILNGSFRFLADLVRCMTIPVEIDFVKVNSYHGTQSTGEVRTLLGASADLRGREVILVEDIVDTGLTIAQLLPQLREAKGVSLITLLRKPDQVQVSLDVQTWVGFDIPPHFVVGYGLDYDGQGREMNDIYKI